MVAWAVGGGNRLSWRPPCTTKVKIVLAFSIADRLSQFSARLLDAFTKLGPEGSTTMFALSLLRLVLLLGKIHTHLPILLSLLGNKHLHGAATNLKQDTVAPRQSTTMSVKRCKGRGLCVATYGVAVAVPDVDCRLRIQLHLARQYNGACLSHVIGGAHSRDLVQHFKNVLVGRRWPQQWAFVSYCNATGCNHQRRHIPICLTLRRWLGTQAHSSLAGQL